MSCTSARVWHTQPWPDSPIDTIPMAPIATDETSMSSKIRFGLLPPSSSDTRTMPSAAACIIRVPTARDPVKVILSTPGWVMSASPVGSGGPVTRLRTPGGRPASSHSSAMRIEVSEAYSLGLSTTVQPAARAGASFWANNITGAFQGMTAATTPTGSLSV